MNCNETRRWLDAHLDGELDPARDREVIEHVRSCPSCTALAGQRTAWSKQVKDALPRFTPSASLRAKIEAALRAERRPAPVSVVKKPILLWWGSGLAAACALFVSGFFFGHGGFRSALLGEELVSGHILALTTGHLTDVVSSDRHTVKPWLAEHIDFSPPVADLATVGFPLAGARVERVGSQRVAALVYRRMQHVITLAVWPSTDAALPAAGDWRGYHVRTWREGEMNFAAISDMAEYELDSFVTQLRVAKPATAEQR